MAFRKKVYNRAKRPAYKRKRTYTRARTIAPSSGILTHPHIYPFANYKGLPRIPDGNAAQTLGTKLQTANEPANNETQYVVLYPGLNAWCSTGVVNGTAITSDHVHHRPGFMNSNVSVQAGGTYLENAGSKEYTKWRTVSAGVRIRCTNGDNNSDGHWEAVRIPIQDADKTFAQLSAGLGTNGVNGQVGSLTPNTSLLAGIGNTTNWQLNNTFQVGKLRNIHEYEFRLRPTDSHHPFRDVDTATNFDVPAVGGLFQKVTATHANLSILDNYLDTSWDCILIRINGTANTKIHVHSVHNMELIPKYDSQAAAYAAETSSTPSILNTAHKKYKQMNKPAYFTKGF